MVEYIVPIRSRVFFFTEIFFRGFYLENIKSLSWWFGFNRIVRTISTEKKIRWKKKDSTSDGHNSDLKQSLENFQNQGSRVPKFQDFLSYVNVKDEHSNPWNHMPCAYYSDTETSKNVKKSDSFIYNTFNMTGCCNPVYSYPTIV